MIVGGVGLQAYGAPEAARAPAWDVLILAFVIATPLILGALVYTGVLRAGALARPGLRPPEFIPWWGWLVAAMVTYIAGAMGGSIGASLVGGALREPPGGLPGSAGAGIGSGVFGVGAGVFVLFLLAQGIPGPPERGEGRDAVRRAGLWPSWSDLRVGLAAFGLTLPIVMTVGVLSTLVYQWVMGEPPPDLAHESLRAMREDPRRLWVVLTALGAVIGAPFFEEIVFRLMLQTAAIRLLRHAWAGVIATSALFAAIHAPRAVLTLFTGDSFAGDAVPPHALPTLFVLGLAMGIAYERTRRPLVPIVVHMGFNAFNVLMAFA